MFKSDVARKLGSEIGFSAPPESARRDGPDMLVQRRALLPAMYRFAFPETLHIPQSIWNWMVLEVSLMVEGFSIASVQRYVQGVEPQQPST